MKVPKGNDKFLQFIRTHKSTGEVITTAPQKIWFTVKASKHDGEEVLIQKKYQGKYGEDEIVYIGDGIWQIHLKPEDTDNLLAGKYFYDIKILDEQGYEKTIVLPRIFEILAVVTENEDEGGDMNEL